MCFCVLVMCCSVQSQVSDVRIWIYFYFLFLCWFHCSRSSMKAVVHCTVAETRIQAHIFCVERYFFQHHWFMRLPVVQKACGILVTWTWSLLLVYFSICCSSALSCVSVLLPLPWCYWSYGSAVSSRVKAGTTKSLLCGLLCTLRSSVLLWKFVGLSVLYHGEFDCHGI